MSAGPDLVAARRERLLAGPLGPTVLWLAWPPLVEQLLSFSVGMFDTWLSGHLPPGSVPGETATSAIGTATYVGWLVSMLFGLVGLGAGAGVARHWGAGDFAAAGRLANRAIVLAVLLGLAGMTAMIAVAPLWTRLLRFDAESSAVAVHYLRCDACGYVFTSVSLTGAAVLRASGDMRTPMMVLSLVSVANVAASWGLVHGIGPLPALGIDGIVGGTVAARVLGGTAMLAVLARGAHGLRLDRRQWTLRGPETAAILRIGLPAGVDGLAMWIGHFLFVMIVNRLAEGDAARAVFAAHMVGIQVEALTYLPAVAWGQAAATITGQSLGAGLVDRARRAGPAACLQCGALGALLTVLYFFGAETIYSAMHESAEVVRLGTPAFRLLAFFQVPLVVSIVLVSALRGAGETRAPLAVTLVGVFGIRVPVAYLCGIWWDGGLTGAWTGMCADVAFRALLVGAVFFRGRWTRTVV